MKKLDQYPNGIVIKSLKDLNQKQLCSSYFQKVLENKKSEACLFCEKNRINKYRDRECTFLCSSNDELYKFWDCLVAIDYLNSKIKNNSESEEKIITIKEKLSEGFQILSGIVKNVYYTIKSRMTLTDKDYKIVLTVNSSDNGQFVIDTINKYYEVSNGYKRDNHDDSVELPIFTKKNNSSTLGDVSSNLDYQIHYIARDIGRIFGTCPTYSEGEDCKHGVKCRKSIHLTVKSHRGEVKYSIDDHLESFREYINEVSDSIFRESSVVSESDFIDTKGSDNSSNSGFGYSDAVKKEAVKTSKKLKIDTTDIKGDIGFWTDHWFGDDGDSNINNLITEMNESTSIELELSKLIKRLIWKSPNSYSRNSNFDKESIIKQWKNYQGYKDGTNNCNIACASIRSATSEKHLSVDYKASDDNNRQRFNKAGRQDSYRYNDFGGFDYKPKAGYNVFNYKMEVRHIDNIENMHLDVMAEYLDIKMFEDPIFIIPNPRETCSFSSKVDEYYNNENYNLLGDKDYLRKLEKEIFEGSIVQEMFKDRNVLNEYKSSLINSSVNKTDFIRSLYGGNWFVKMYFEHPRNFLCLMFYFNNKDKKEYESIDIKMCIKQYCWYGQSLERLKDPQCIKLHVNGIDTILFSTLPEKSCQLATQLTREEFLNILTEYLINHALARHLSNFAPDEVKDYKRKLEEESNSKGNDNTFEKNCMVQKLHFKFLEMSENLKNEKFNEEVLKLTLEHLEGEKEWKSNLLIKEGKRRNQITPEYIAGLIDKKLGLSDRPLMNGRSRLSSLSPVYRSSMREISTRRDQINTSIDKHEKDIICLRKKMRLLKNPVDKESIELDINRIRNQIRDLNNESKELDSSERSVIDTEEEIGVDNLCNRLAEAAHKICTSRPQTPVTPTQIKEGTISFSQRRRSQSNLSLVSIES